MEDHQPHRERGEKYDGRAEYQAKQKAHGGPIAAGLRGPGPRGPESNRHLSDGRSAALPVELRSIIRMLVPQDPRELDDRHARERVRGER